MPEPLVSVCCLAYNHEPYMRECLDGFLRQQTDFPFEVLIHDDASTDATASIIREYEAKFPDVVKPIYQKENQYSRGIGVTRVYQFPRARGRYIALCEGDDCWTDPLKLQKQVDFLEAHPDYGLVHTNYQVVDGRNNPLHKLNRTWPSGDVFNLIMNGPYNIGTATVLFRRRLYEECKDELKGLHFKMGDVPMWLMFSRASKFKYLDDVTANYRMLRNSASHSDDIEKFFRFHEDAIRIREHFSKKYNAFYDREKAFGIFCYKVIKECYEKKQPSLAGQYYAKLLRRNARNVFRPRPLLFFLGARYKLFDGLIKLIYAGSSRKQRAAVSPHRPASS